MRKGTLWGVPRLATHGWVLALALIVLGLAPLELRHPVADASATVEGLRVPLVTSIDQAPAAASVQPVADLPPLAAYQAKSGDTVASVAAKAGIHVDTLTQLNQLVSMSLNPGQRLLVPPVDGTLVPIDPNQSLELLAQTFRIDPEVLRKLNRLAPDSKLPGELFIPAVKTDAIAPPVAPGTADPSTGRERVVRFVWPTQGVITQYFWQYHPGLDIANDTGTPEVAADGGKVVWAGWGDYGIYVEIDHGNGFHTIYAHMSKVLVNKDQMVAKGQLLGLMGATGRATGPHLHFEIRYQGVPQNPLDLLP
ncbi:MAG TPA: M23 family metallopeptidase [Candidatus Dormibacteraeota bacterium]|nr:M23 family metallopeptidase [Candidatus Dormibacteraeota bacterium]